MFHRAASGFTLIELLVVVAIIAMLAAFAVPNFLEAQARAKISATVSGLRVVATALEAYRVDTDRYPVAEFSDGLAERLARLTSPVAYLVQLPEDPFYRRVPGEYGGSEPQFVYAPGNIYAAGAPVFAGTSYRHQIFSVSGRGPDSQIYFGAYCMAHPIPQRNKSHLLGAYDPTNGTISSGDIFRLGGSALK